VRERYEEAGIIAVRIGLPPKRAIPFRVNDPFAKYAVVLIPPNGGAEEKIEFLGDGQQLIVDGIHPKTGEPYAWFGAEIGSFARDDLPYIHEQQARQLVDDAVALLVRNFGYQVKQTRAKQKIDGEDVGGGSEDWGVIVDNIVAGTALHDSLRDLAAKLVTSGMGQAAAKNFLRGLMEKSKAPRDERWRDRYAEIDRLVESAGAFREEHPQEKPIGLQEWDAGDDTDLPPPRGWLLGNSFCRGFMSALISQGGVGKTALRYAQLISLAIGRPLTGEYVFQRARVLLVSLEDDDKELKRRILAARIHHNVDRSEVKGWLFLAAPGAAGGKLMTMENGRVVRGTLADKLEAIITERKIDLIYLDPFVKTHAVPENTNTDIDQVAQVLTDLAAKHGVAVDLPHHAAKGASDPGSADRGRGASAHRDACRLVYTLTTMSAEEAEVFAISEEQRHTLVRVDSAKVNITKHLGAAKWFRIVSVPLGNANDIYPHGDEVQTVEPWTPPDTWEGLSSHLLNQILTAIDNGMEDGRRYTDGSRAEDRAAWKVITEHAPTKTKGQAREIIKTWVKNGVLVRHEYNDPVARKPANGVKVNPAKRPS
jgi:polyhydroxyalkanoate synthesis regulator phasin